MAGVAAGSSLRYASALSGQARTRIPTRASVSCVRQEVVPRHVARGTRSRKRLATDGHERAGQLVERERLVLGCATIPQGSQHVVEGAAPSRRLTQHQVETERGDRAAIVHAEPVARLVIPAFEERLLLEQR